MSKFGINCERTELCTIVQDLALLFFSSTRVSFSELPEFSPFIALFVYIIINFSL